jgi:tetratricopeptide (TPR) repeat protein
MTNLATGLAFSIVSLWTKTPEADLDRAEALAARALALDPHDAACRYAVGVVHRMRRRFDDAIAELEASIRLNPNAHLTYSTLGITRFSPGAAMKLCRTLPMRSVSARATAAVHWVFWDRVGRISARQ